MRLYMCVCMSTSMFFVHVFLFPLWAYIRACVCVIAHACMHACVRAACMHACVHA